MQFDLRLRVPLLVLLLGLAGCSGEPNAGKTPKNGLDAELAGSNTLLYGRGGDANTLDPIHTDIGESVKVIVNVFDIIKFK